MRPALLAAATCFILSVGPAWAESLPSFNLTDCASHATHIVVVDDKGKVLESWAGDLKPGDRVPVGDFRLPTEPKVSRLAELGLRDEAKLPEKVPTRRLVLFLRKKNAKVVWQPARRFDQYDISTAWVHGGKVYTLQQLFNPGPVELFPIAAPEASFKKQVMAIHAVKALNR